MIGFALMVSCVANPFVPRTSAPEPDATEVSPATPLTLSFPRKVDASDARIVWLARGTQVGQVPGNSEPGRLSWRNIDLTELNQPVRAELEVVDARTLRVRPLDRPPSGRIQDVRVLGVRSGSEEGTVSLQFRTRRNPLLSERWPVSGDAVVCTVDGQRRYRMCAQGRTDAKGVIDVDDLQTLDRTRDYTYQGPSLVQVNIDTRSSITSWETFEYDTWPMPVRWELGGTDDDDERIVFVAMDLQVDDAGRVTEARQSDAATIAGIGQPDDRWQSWSWELDADGRATALTLAYGERVADPGEAWFHETFAHDEATGGVVESRVIDPGPEQWFDGRVAEIRERAFDAEGRLAGILRRLGEGSDIVDAWRFERDSNGFVSREWLVSGPGPDQTWLTDDDVPATEERWFDGSFDADGQRQWEEEWSPGPDGQPFTDDDVLLRRFDYAPW
ncbi:MAG: hypothetical protein AAF602_22500 [Myxococcota bacterium]